MLICIHCLLYLYLFFGFCTDICCVYSHVSWNTQGQAKLFLGKTAFWQQTISHTAVSVANTIYTTMIEWPKQHLHTTATSVRPKNLFFHLVQHLGRIQRDLLKLLIGSLGPLARQLHRRKQKSTKHQTQAPPMAFNEFVANFTPRSSRPNKILISTT